MWGDYSRGSQGQVELKYIHWCYIRLKALDYFKSDKCVNWLSVAQISQITARLKWSDKDIIYVHVVKGFPRSQNGVIRFSLSDVNYKPQQGSGIHLLSLQHTLWSFLTSILFIYTVKNVELPACGEKLKWVLRQT